MTDNLFKKIALFTDIHYGRKSGSEEANLDNLAFTEWFIDRAKTHNVDAVAFLGDYFDNRHQIGVASLNHGLRGLEMINNAFPRSYFIVGNHDLLYRDKRDMTSMAFAKHLPNITLVNKPMTFGEGKHGVTFLPWLVKDERKSINKLASRYVFLHGEISGFMMNAKVPIPDHPDHLNTDDFKGIGHAYSGHFHYAQSSANFSYIGNAFGFDFSDSWDEARGLTILEWGKDPIQESWPDQPLYRTMTLSQLLNEPDRMLCQKLTARVTLDLDISFEEAQVVRDEYIKRYSMRKIELIHQGKQNMVQEYAGDVVFQSVDQIVIDGLLSVQSDNFQPSKLVDIYRNLGTH